MLSCRIGAGCRLPPANPASRRDVQGRRRRLRAVLAALALAGLPATPAWSSGDPTERSDADRQATRYTIKLIDGSTGLPTAARVRIVGPKGQDLYPEGQLYHTAYSGHHYFYADGEFSLDLPPGRQTIYVAKGFEYWNYQQSFDVPRDTPRSGRTVTLSRFADLRLDGFRSGDTHVHTNHGGGPVYTISRSNAFLMQRAEDLAVANLLEDATEFTGVLDPLSTADYKLYVGGEFRSAFWGHLDVLGVSTMPYLFCCSTGQPAFPMNVDLVRDARARGGMVFFAHPLTVPRNQIQVTDQGWPSVGHGRELPIDVALGVVDAIDIASYSNLNRFEFQLWYDLLNYGFRLPATAGTDASVNRVEDPMMGGYRVYAQVGNAGFSHADWLQAVRRGDSFITNGPLIRRFRVSGAAPGSVVTKTPAESNSCFVSFDVVSQWPISYAALVVNGSYQHQFFPSGDGRTLTGTSTANLGGASGWVSLFVYANWPNPGPFFTFGSLLYAHSNPVYIDVPGHPKLYNGINPNYYPDWINEVWSLADSRGWTVPADRDSALARVNLARSILLARTPPGVAAPSSGGGPAASAPRVSARATRSGRRVEFRFEGAPNAPETLDLFDVQGRPIWTERLLQLSTTRTATTWTIPEGALRPAAGLYFARFRGLGWSATARVTLP